MNRFFAVSLFLLGLLVFGLHPALTYAADIPLATVIPGGKSDKKFPLTPEMIEEALDTSTNCKAYYVTNTAYDCDCLGMTMLEMRQKQGMSMPRYDLENIVRAMCPNTAAMAGKYYEYCLSWAPNQMGSQSKEFCECYGRQYAKIYARNPSDNQLVREAQMTAAMSNCKFSDLKGSSNDRQKWIDQMKQKNLYDQLLPGAKDDPMMNQKP